MLRTATPDPRTLGPDDTAPMDAVDAFASTIPAPPPSMDVPELLLGEDLTLLASEALDDD